VPLASSILSYLLLCDVSVALVLGHQGCVSVVGGGGPGVGGSRHCGGHPCHGGTCCKDFCLGGCCGAGQLHHSHRRCGRLGCIGGEVGMGEAMEIGGGERHDVGLCS
jgi:hypothetical protein